MRRALALRLSATAATVLSLLAFTGYVAANAKNPTAPLQPPIAQPSASAAPSATPTPRPSGRIQIGPGVRATDLPAITFTHVS